MRFAIRSCRIEAREHCACGANRQTLVNRSLTYTNSYLNMGFAANLRAAPVLTSVESRRSSGLPRGTVLTKTFQLRHAAALRADWDALKAILHNCKKHGPESQNRDGHPDFEAQLRGRIAYMSWLSPTRGDKLRRLWNEINWGA